MRMFEQLSSHFRALSRHASHAMSSLALVSLGLALATGCTSGGSGNEELLRGNIGVQLEISGGNNQSRSTNQVFASDLTVRAVDSLTQTPVASLTVIFTEITDTRSQVLNPIGVTDSNGYASTKVRSGPVTDATVTIEARIQDTNTSANFSLRTLGSGSGTRFVLDTTNGRLETAGKPFAFIVSVRDDAGNIVTEYNSEIDFQWSFGWSATQSVTGWTPDGVSWGGSSPTLPPATERIQFVNGLYISPASYFLHDARTKLVVNAGDGENGLSDISFRTVEVAADTINAIGLADAPGGPSASAKFYTYSGNDQVPDVVVDADQVDPVNLYAVALDSSGNYGTDISATWGIETVTKDAENFYPDILTDYLTPALPGPHQNVAFAPTRSGRTKITISSSGKSSSRVIHVNHGAPAQLLYKIYDKADYDDPAKAKTPLALSDSKLPVEAGKKFYIEVNPSDQKGNILDQKYNISPSADSGTFSGTAKVKLKWNESTLPQSPVVSGGNTPSIVRESCSASCDVLPDQETTITFVDGVPNVKLISYLNVATPSADNRYPELTGRVELTSSGQTITIPDTASSPFSTAKGAPNFLNLYRVSNEAEFDTLRKATVSHVFPGAVTPSPNDPGPYGNTVQSPLRALTTGEMDTYRLGIEDEGGNRLAWVSNTEPISITLSGGWAAGSKPQAWTTDPADSAYLLKYAPQSTNPGTLAITLTAAQIAAVVPGGYEGPDLTTTFAGGATPNDLKYFAVNVFDKETENTNLTSTSTHYLALWFRDQYDNVLSNFIGNTYSLKVTYTGASNTYDAAGALCSSANVPVDDYRNYKIDTILLNSIATPVLHVPHVPTAQDPREWIPAEFQLPKIGTGASIRVTGEGVQSQKSFADDSALVPNVLPGEAVSLRIERILPETVAPSNQVDVDAELQVTCSSPYKFTARTYDAACNPKENVTPEWKIVAPGTDNEIDPAGAFTAVPDPGNPDLNIPPSLNLEGILTTGPVIAAKATYLTLPAVETGDITFTPGSLDSLSITRITAGANEVAGTDFYLTIKQADCRGNERTNFTGNTYMTVDITKPDGSSIPATTANPNSTAQTPIIHKTPLNGSYPFGFTAGVSTDNKFTFFNTAHVHKITFTDPNLGSAITKDIGITVENAVLDHFKVTHNTPGTKWRAGQTTVFTVDAFDLYENRILTTPQPSLTFVAADAGVDRLQRVTATSLAPGTVTGLNTKTVTGDMVAGLATFTVRGDLVGTITPTATSGTKTHVNYPVAAPVATRATIYPEALVNEVRWASADQTLAGTQTAGQNFKNAAGTPNGTAVTIHDRFGNQIKEKLNPSGDTLRVYLHSTTANTTIPAGYTVPTYKDALYLGPQPLDKDNDDHGVITIDTGSGDPQQDPPPTYQATLQNFKYASAPDGALITIHVIYEDPAYISDGSGDVGTTEPFLPKTDISVLRGQPKHVFGLLTDCQTSDFIHGVLTFGEAIQTVDPAACTKSADVAMPVKIYTVDDGFNPVAYDNAGSPITLASTDPNETTKTYSTVSALGRVVSDFYSHTANNNPFAKDAPDAAWYLQVSAPSLVSPPYAPGDPEYVPNDEVLPPYLITAGTPTRTVALIDTLDGTNSEKLLSGTSGGTGIFPAPATDPMPLVAGADYQVDVLLTDGYFNQVHSATYNGTSISLKHDDPSTHADPAYTTTYGSTPGTFTGGKATFTFNDVTADRNRLTYKVYCGDIAASIATVTTECETPFSLSPGPIVRTLVYFDTQEGSRKGGATTRAEAIATPGSTPDYKANASVTAYLIGVDAYFNKNTTFNAADIDLTTTIGKDVKRVSITTPEPQGTLTGVYQSTIKMAQVLPEGEQIVIDAADCLTHTGDDASVICRSNDFNVTAGDPANLIVKLDPSETYSQGYFALSDALAPASTTANVDADFTAKVYVTDSTYNLLTTSSYNGTSITLDTEDPNYTATSAASISNGEASFTFKHRTASSNPGATSPYDSTTHQLQVTGAVPISALTRKLSNTYTVNPDPTEATMQAVIRIRGPGKEAGKGVQPWNPGKSDFASALPQYTPELLSTSPDHPFTVDVMVVDKYFNLIQTYTRAGVTVTSDDPGTTSLPSGSLVNGKLNLSITPLSKQAAQYLTPSNTGVTNVASQPYKVEAGNAKYTFVTQSGQTFTASPAYLDPNPSPGTPPQISGTPDIRRAGVTFPVNVYITDKYGNPVATGFNVDISSTDGNDADATGVAMATGAVTSATSLENRTVGTYTITAAPSTANAAITPVASASYQVKAGPPEAVILELPGQTHRAGFAASSPQFTATPTTQTGGVAFDITAILTDKWSNLVDPVSYTDDAEEAAAEFTVTSDSARVVIPTGLAFTSGTKTFSVTDYIASTTEHFHATITNTSLTGTTTASSNISINPAPAKYILIQLVGQSYNGGGYSDGLTHLSSVISTPTGPGTNPIDPVSENRLLPLSTTDDSYEITVRAVDAFLNVSTEITGDVTIRDNCDLQTYTGTFAAGVATLTDTVQSRKPCAGKTIEVTETTGDALAILPADWQPSSAFDIWEGAPTHLLAVINPDQTFTAGVDTLAEAVTGTITTKTAGTEFDVDVYGTDAHFNPITAAHYPSANKAFALASSDAIASLPVTPSLGNDGHLLVQVTNFTGNDPGDVDSKTTLSVGTNSSFATNNTLEYKTQANSATSTVIVFDGQESTPNTSGSPSISPAATPGIAGQDVNVTVYAVDDYFNRNYGATGEVTLAMTPDNGARDTITGVTPTLDQGVATFTINSEVAEVKTLTATVGAVAGHSANITVKNSTPTQVLITSDNTTADVNTAHVATVTLKDTFGNLAKDQAYSLDFSITAFPPGADPAVPEEAAMAASVTPVTADTDPASGTGTTTITLGKIAGDYELTAALTETPTTLGTLTYGATAEDATRLVFALPSQNPLAKTSPQITVNALDQYGNIDLTFSPVADPKSVTVQKKENGTDLDFVDVAPTPLTLLNGSATIVIPHPSATENVVDLQFVDSHAIGLATLEPAQLSFDSPAVLAIDGGTTYDFGPHQLGATVVRVFTVTNSGDVEAGSLGWNSDYVGLAPQFGFAGATPAFPGDLGTFAGTPCTSTLAAGASCKIAFQFSPDEVASYPEAAGNKISLSYHDQVDANMLAERPLMAVGGQPGSVDTNFNPTPTAPSVPGNNITRVGNKNAAANDIVVDDEGTILVAGNAYNPSNNSDVALVRYTRTGLVETAPAPRLYNYGGNNEYAHSIALESTGLNNYNIFLAGYTSDGSITAAFVQKLTKSGNPVSGFGDEMLGTGTQVILDDPMNPSASIAHSIKVSAGSLYVAGMINSKFMVAKLDSTTGALDTTFGDAAVCDPGPCDPATQIGYATFDFGHSALGDESEAHDLYVDTAGGAIYATGFTRYADGTVQELAVAKFNLADGVLLDSNTFLPAPATQAIARSIAVDSSNRIYLGGDVGGSFAMYRIDSSLDLDPSFNALDTPGYRLTALTGGSTEDAANQLLIDGQDRPVLVGKSKSGTADDLMNFAVIRYTTSGILDTSFGDSSSGIMTIDLQPGKNDEANAVAIEPALDYIAENDASRKVSDGEKLVVVGKSYVNFSIGTTFAVTRIFGRGTPPP